MAMVCRFGDEESSEEVPCQLDSTSDTIRCEQPRRRQLPFRDFKMQVTLVSEGEEEEEEGLAEMKRLIPGRQQQKVEIRKASGLLRQQVFRATLSAMLGEFIGTCLLTLVICTSVAVSVIAGNTHFSHLVLTLSLCMITLCRCSRWSMAGSSGEWLGGGTEHLLHWILL